MNTEPYFLLDLNFQQISSNIFSQYVQGFTFVDSFSAEIYKFD